MSGPERPAHAGPRSQDHPADAGRGPAHRRAARTASRGGHPGGRPSGDQDRSARGQRSPLFDQAAELLDEAGWGLDELYAAASDGPTRERPVPGARTGDLRTEGSGLRPGSGGAHGGSTEIPPPPDTARPGGGNLGVTGTATAAAGPRAPRGPLPEPSATPLPLPGWDSGVQPGSECSLDRYQPPCRPCIPAGRPPSTAAGPASAGPGTRANSVSYERYRWRPMGATTEEHGLSKK